MDKGNKYRSYFQAADSFGLSFHFDEKAPEVYRTSTIYEKGKGLIAAISNVFNGKEDSCSCKPTGYISVYLKDSIVLHIDVATSASGSGKDCEFLIVKEGDKKKCYKLNYMLGRYIDEYYDLMK